LDLCLRQELGERRDRIPLDAIRSILRIASDGLGIEQISAHKAALILGLPRLLRETSGHRIAGSPARDRAHKNY
jgi:hypothetical protein